MGGERFVVLRINGDNVHRGAMVVCAVCIRAGYGIGGAVCVRGNDNHCS